MFKKPKQTKLAFTLIELLVVIAIIGLLATLSVVALSNTRARARDSRRVSDVKQIHTALELYYNAANQYPEELISGSILEHNGVTFLDPIPTAPTPPDGDCNNEDNVYQYNKVDSNNYILYYCLGNNTGGLEFGISYASPISLQTSIGSQGDVIAFAEAGQHIWTVPSGTNSIEVLVVAGGGGGGAVSGGGGGAGGLIFESSYSVIPGNNISLTVGDGGAGGTDRNTRGENGEDSVFLTLTAIGGGGGGSISNREGLSGGSGGGANSRPSALGGNAVLGGMQGSDGGDGVGVESTSSGSGAGGGGYSEAGQNTIDQWNAGDGGSGAYFGDIFGNEYGESGWFSGGGGGGYSNHSNNPNGYAGVGGNGGGGDGRTGSTAGVSGSTNTGGGGGGGGYNGSGWTGGNGGKGGSGIVLIKY